MNYKKTMNKGQKQKILQNKRIKYNEMDQSKKLLTKNMNYRKTMSKEEKRKTLENKRAKYEAMDQSKKEELLNREKEISNS